MGVADATGAEYRRVSAFCRHRGRSRASPTGRDADNVSPNRRCLVPASSFVEWQAVAGSRRKQPWFVYLADLRPMAFAGLWAFSHTEDGERIESCTIVTTPANALMAEIRNTRKRMPVVLKGRSAQDAWQSGTKEEDLAVAEPLADGLLDVHPSSTSINNPNAIGPELLEPFPLE